jgi:hypothetical protein
MRPEPERGSALEDLAASRAELRRLLGGSPSAAALPAAEGELVGGDGPFPRSHIVRALLALRVPPVLVVAGLVIVLANPALRALVLRKLPAGLIAARLLARMRA